MRTTFINTLLAEAEKNEKIFLITGDLGYSVLEPFAEKFPDRFLNIGIAEQNMAGVAAGLAKEGYNVFIYSIGNFPTLRCLEQIRYDICYHQLSVKVVAVGAGYAYGPLGVSHHTTEDISVMRALPGLLVTSPGCPNEVAAATIKLCREAGPGYIRLNKAGEPKINSLIEATTNKCSFELISGEGTVVLTTGAVLADAKQFITSRGLGWGLVSCPYIHHSIDQELVEISKKYKRWITFEEHQLSGGFGSFILERLNNLKEDSRLLSVPDVYRCGIPDKFIGFAGDQNYLRSQVNLNLERYL